jgi:hypothetical protein
MKSNSFFYSLFFISFLFVLASCDNDSNEIGANIVGNDNFGLGTPDIYSVNAFTQPLQAVETNNLPVQQLGIYDNPVFGKTTAHIVTQVQLAAQPTVINYDRTPVIDSVVLNVPYLSHLLTTEADVDTPNVYELDSVYNKTSKINLQVYESNYYQRTIDPATGLPQKYYSDQLPQFEAERGTVLLNDNADVKQNTEFVFTEKGWFTTDDEGIKTKVGPSMNVRLNNDFFTNKIMAQSASANLANNNVFSNYFRGLHFKVGPSGSDTGAYALLDITKGTIKIYYHEFDVAPSTAVVNKTLLMNLTGSRVNLFENAYTTTYANLLTQTPEYNGSEKLYLKGGEGSMAVIELFKEPGELEALRASRDQWLVNDASLTFYIENSTDNGMGQGITKADEPNRIYLYDLDNKRQLIDYQTDQSTSISSVKYNKKIHGGIIEKASDERGTQYKIRITNHIRNIIYKDSTNVRLGLVVTENINVTTNKSLKTPKVLPVSGTFDPFTIKETPVMSVSNPFGTILWGSAPSVPEDKKLKLIIYYTKPN